MHRLICCNLFGLLLLSTAGCSTTPEKAAGRSFENAGSVIKHYGDKAWMEPEPNATSKKKKKEDSSS